MTKEEAEEKGYEIAQELEEGRVRAWMPGPAYRGFVEVDLPESLYDVIPGLAALSLSETPGVEKALSGQIEDLNNPWQILKDNLESVLALRPPQLLKIRLEMGLLKPGELPVWAESLQLSDEQIRDVALQLVNQGRKEEDKLTQEALNQIIEEKFAGDVFDYLETMAGLEGWLNYKRGYKQIKAWWGEAEAAEWLRPEFFTHLTGQEVQSIVKEYFSLTDEQLVQAVSQRLSAEATLDQILAGVPNSLEQRVSNLIRLALSSDSALQGQLSAHPELSDRLSELIAQEVKANPSIDQLLSSLNMDDHQLASLIRQQLAYQPKASSSPALPSDPTDEQIQARIREELLSILVEQGVGDELEARVAELSTGFGFSVASPFNSRLDKRHRPDG